MCLSCWKLLGDQREVRVWDTPSPGTCRTPGCVHASSGTCMQVQIPRDGLGHCEPSPRGGPVEVLGSTLDSSAFSKFSIVSGAQRPSDLSSLLLFL